MDIREIKRLVELMVDADLSELDITEGENTIHLRRGGAMVAPVAVAPVPVVAPIAPVPVVASASAAPAVAAGEKLIEVRSPMVGTFYSAPGPDSEPYVAVGATVSDDSVVCIIEAMKVMNEIKAECKGVIVELCVKNAHPVEYGQVLYKVRPS